MRKKKRNPLRKRVFRELKGDWRKYLVVSLFLILTIGFVSGMYVANGSMSYAIEESYTKYKLEDGHFELKSKVSDEVISEIETGEMAGAYDLNNADFSVVPVNIYEQFFKNTNEDNNNDGTNDGTIRVYTRNDEINEACVMEGRLPETKNEIAIDRMHADNAGIEVGNDITIGGVKYQVVGLIAYVNYMTLHEKNTDLIFDALNFDVAMMTEEGFDELSSAVHYSYSWSYQNKPADEIEEKKLSDNFMKALLTQTVVADTEITDYVPVYANQAVQFAPDDIGSDKAMGGVLLYILIVVIGFIFAITIATTITREASQIGTLRSSGYTKGELIRHYLSMPIMVTLISAVIGNILGYTVFKNVVVGMYYNSYSLPTYETLWNGSAFIRTTVVPLIIMIVVNLVIIIRMMQYSPLRFLHHDFKNTKRKKAMRLPRWKFFSRFRLRVMLQNIPNYLILFVGILLVATMLAMAVGMPDTLKYYKDNASDLMFAKYQYVLKDYEEDGELVSTKTDGAETFSMKSLIHKSDTLDEEISVYGIADDSQYVKIDDLEQLEINEVYVSRSFMSKYRFGVGDTITLNEKYENKQYQFTVSGIYENCQTLAVFMAKDTFNEVFDQDAGAFSGFLSDQEITDLATDNVATVITKKDITKMCDQLDHSMGSYMVYFQYLCILLSAVLIYLLTKIIIEKNENAISMTKILGYSNGEIAGLYMLSTTIVVITADALSVFLGVRIMGIAWEMMLSSFSGWFKFEISPIGYVKIFGFILIGYLLVMYFDFIRIKKIPMDEALKNVE